MEDLFSGNYIGGGLPFCCEMMGGAVYVTLPNKEDYRLSMENIRHLPPTQYPGITIIFMIQGEATVKSSVTEHHLREDDLLVINHNEKHTVQSTQDNVMIVLHIAGHFFALHYEEYFHCQFHCSPNEMDYGREHMVGILRRHLSEMIISSSKNDARSNLEIQSNLYRTMLLLTQFFKREVSLKKGDELYDERITHIINYMEQNYNEPLTLKEVAEREYLSVSYLSRYFKKMTGVGFLQYLNQIRLKHSLEDLIYTTDSISQIAINNGFFSAKNFSTIFKATYGQTPSQYRQEHPTRKRGDTEELVYSTEIESLVLTPEILGQLSKYIEAADTNQILNEVEFVKREIRLDSKKAIDVAASNHILVIGELKELLKDNVRRQVLLSKQELRITHIGIRNLIYGRTLLPEVETDELIATSSPYVNVDITLQFLREQDLDLFIRIEYQEISKDEEKYFKLLDDFLRHALNVFGSGFVGRWHVLYYDPQRTLVPASELRRVYLRLHQTLKNRSSAIQVGAYMPFSEQELKISASHRWQLDEMDRIDFISYSANQNEVVDFENNEVAEFKETQDYILSKTLALKKYLKQHLIYKPLFLITWNTLSGNTRYTNGTFFRGALIMKTIFDLSSEVDGIGFWINTELHEEDQPGRNISLDGLELFHYFSGKRPAYYAVQFKERLKGKVIAQGNEYIMTQNEEGYQLVLFNRKNFNPRYSVEEIFVRSLRKELHIHLFGLEPGPYQIRKFIFDRSHGALYSKWGELNSKYGQDLEVMNYIVQASLPTLELMDDWINQDWSFYAYLDINAIHFIELRKIYE